jgi:hypothetical protein
LYSRKEHVEITCTGSKNVISHIYEDLNRNFFFICSFHLWHSFVCLSSFKMVWNDLKHLNRTIYSFSHHLERQPSFTIFTMFYLYHCKLHSTIIASSTPALLSCKGLVTFQDSVKNSKLAYYFFCSPTSKQVKQNYSKVRSSNSLLHICWVDAQTIATTVDFSET